MKPITDEEIEALRKRNADRAAAAIARMGKRYACHPVHAPRRVEPVRPLLQAGPR